MGELAATIADAQLARLHSRVASFHQTCVANARLDRCARRQERWRRYSATLPAARLAQFSSNSLRLINIEKNFFVKIFLKKKHKINIKNKILKCLFYYYYCVVLQYLVLIFLPIAMRSILQV